MCSISIRDAVLERGERVQTFVHKNSIKIALTALLKPQGSQCMKLEKKLNYIF
jgi:hypothetical protein